jgi:gliding motility associated protien GldN
MPTRFSKLFCLITAFLFFSQVLIAQASFYPSDTIWRRTVHRILDLESPRNKALRHFPDSLKSNYRSLIQVIIDGVETYGVDAYSEVEGTQFVGLMTLNEMYDNMGGKVDTIWVDDVDNEDAPQTMEIIHEGGGLDAVVRYEIIEEYYFVKSTSRFSRSIIGIKPIVAFVKDDPTDNEAEEPVDSEENLTFKEVAWFRFDQLKDLLEVAQMKNPANQNSFSNYLTKFESGDFDSYIIELNNNFGVGIADYTDAQQNPNEPTLQMILESRRIEYELFNFEMNLWEY